MLPFLAISAGIHLAAAFGMAYSYARQDIAVPASVGQPAATIKAVVKTDESAEDSAILAAESVTPANVNTEAAGPYSMTFKNSTGATYTAQGADLAEFLVSAKYCPGDVCNQSTNSFVRTHEPVYIADTYGNIVYQSTSGSSTSLSTIVDTAGTTMRKIVRFAPAGSTTWNHALYIPAGQIKCPDGYTFNAASTAGGANKCELANLQQAQSTAAKNSVCYIGSFNSYDQFDPDCQRLVENGNLQAVPGGVQLKNDPVAPTQVTTITAAQGAKMISLLEKMSDGSYRRQDSTVSSAGTVGATGTTHYPNSPPPAYPGDATGIGSGGVNAGTSSGVSGSTCGGPGQPACTVKIEGSGGSGEGLDFSAPPGPGFGEAFGDLQESTVTVSNVCPRSAFVFTMPFPEPIGDYTADGGVICDVVGDYGELFRRLNIIFGFIGATFIVLRS